MSSLENDTLCALEYDPQVATVLEWWVEMHALPQTERVAHAEAMLGAAALLDNHQLQQLWEGLAEVAPTIREIDDQRRQDDEALAVLVAEEATKHAAAMRMANIGWRQQARIAQ